MSLVDFLADGDHRPGEELRRSTPRRGWSLTRWLDRGAVGLSMLCLVHCLAFPLVVMALPAMGEILPRQWWVHPVIFALAVPMATIALVSGWSDHRDRRPVLLGGIGLALLGLGLLAAEASAAEVLLTVAGGLIVAAAHLLNWRLGRHGHASA
jgi:uncharacterized membrane protein